MGWLFNPAVRKLLTLLAQHGFQFVCPDAQAMMDSVLHGFCNSVIMEKAFQKLQGIGRASKNSRSSRLRRYYQPHMAGLMQEMGRAEIEPATELPADLPARLPAAAFEAEGAAPSIDIERLKGISAGKSRDYPSTSAQGLQIQVAAWRLLCQACREDRLEQVGDSWLALLLHADGIVVNTTSGQAFLVLKVCALGALLWPCRRFATASAVCFAPSTEEHVRYMWAAILDTAEWQCIPTKVLPPHVSRLALGRDASVSGGIRAIQVSEAQTPEVSAALGGFAALNATYLDKLASRIGVFAGISKKDWPKQSLERLEAMIRFLVPSIKDDTMSEILKARVGLGGKGPRLSVLMSNENLEHSTACLDPNDHEDAKEYKKDIFKAKRTVQAASADFLVARKYITPQVHTDLNDEAWTLRA